MVKRLAYTFFVNKKLCRPQCPPVCIYDQVFVLTKFSALWWSHGCPLNLWFNTCSSAFFT